jgi:nitrate reductase beta subunit
VGITPETADAMYSLLAVAKYTDRYVIPTMREEGELNLHREQGHSGYPDAT